MRSELLDARPHTAVLYARAVAGTVLPGFLWGGGDEIPDLTLTMSEVRFTPDQVHDYRQVCGGAGPDLPATMLHLAGFPLAMQLMTARSFPMGALGMVHIANRIEVRSVLPALAPYAISVHIDSPVRHPKGTQFDVVTSADLEDERVWVERSTYLSRGTTLATATRDATRPEWPAAPATAEIVEVEVAADMGRRYGAISGDRNPIHMYPLAARAFGFPTTIVHGMWTLARCLAQVEEALPAAYVVEAGFFRPVLLPARCTLAVAAAPGGHTVWMSSGDTVNAVVDVRDSS